MTIGMPKYAPEDEFKNGLDTEKEKIAKALFARGWLVYRPRLENPPDSSEDVATRSRKIREEREKVTPKTFAVAHNIIAAIDVRGLKHVAPYDVDKPEALVALGFLELPEADVGVPNWASEGPRDPNQKARWEILCTMQKINDGEQPLDGAEVKTEHDTV